MKAGRTGVIDFIHVVGTDGEPVSSLVYNTPGLFAFYIRSNNNEPQEIPLADMAPGTWVSGGFKVLSATDMPGTYAFGIPNAALAAGADSVIIQFGGIDNVVFTPLRIQLESYAVAGDIPTAQNIWENATRSLTDKTNFELIAAYNPAKSAAQAGDAMALITGAITSSKIAAGALSGKGDWNTVAPDNASTAAILAVVQCDKVAILVEGVYWMSYRVAGTATEIMRKQMLDANGDPVASITTPVAALQGAD